MSSTTSSQAFLLDQEYQQDEMGMLGFPLNPSFNFNMIPPFSNYPQYSLKALSGLASASALAASEAASSSSPTTTSHQLLSLHTSTINPWEWGEECGRRKREKETEGENSGGATGMKMIKRTLMKRRRKVREPRFCFKTMSDVDVLDDGYKWRKYGQKVVKNTHHPRSYYRCTQDKCRVKKRVERLAEDPRMVITTYEGRHVHSPSNDLQDSHTDSSQLSTLFW